MSKTGRINYRRGMRGLTKLERDEFKNAVRGRISDELSDGFFAYSIPSSTRRLK
jgi:hypothetical protein